MEFGPEELTAPSCVFRLFLRRQRARKCLVLPAEPRGEVRTLEAGGKGGVSAARLLEFVNAHTGLHRAATGRPTALGAWRDEFAARLARSE